MYQSVDEAVALRSSIGDRMTEENFVAARNQTFDSFPTISQHHHWESEYHTTQDIHDIQLDPVEYLDPMHVDVSIKQGNTIYKH